jgi:hypothetical protein
MSTPRRKNNVSQIFKFWRRRFDTYQAVYINLYCYNSPNGTITFSLTRSSLKQAKIIVKKIIIIIIVRCGRNERSLVRIVIKRWRC